jgi:DNA-binding response OmpR family regulator
LKTTTDTARIVILEDDLRLVRTLTRYLKRENYQVTAIDTSKVLFNKLNKNEVDLVILDLNLPQEDGMSIARHMRSICDVPIIIITGRIEIPERIAGLDAGADDYLTKPFDPSELLARIRSLLRRSLTHNSLPVEPQHNATLQFANIVFEPHSRRLYNVKKEDIQQKLTGRESLLLSCLLEQVEQEVSRQALTRYTLGREWEPNDRSLDVHISNIRKKLKYVSQQNISIIASRNHGYSLVKN